MTPIEDQIVEDYKNRINRVFLYIDNNLDSDLSLITISEIAYFSPFHFHRIFRFITGETLNEYVTRKRLEKSALDLIHKKRSIQEISLRYGFTSNSTFTRAFKKFYGVSPSIFKKQHPYKFSKIRQLKSKIGQKYPEFEKYICLIDELKKWINMNATIQIKELSRMELAYVSSIGPQNLQGAYQKILQWAIPKDLIHEETRMLTLYHDSFKVTEPSKVRMSACVILEEPFETNDGIGKTAIDGGKYIVARFEIGKNEFEKSWTGMFIWMNENGYIKADKDPFEIFYNNPNEHPEKKAIVDLCIPVA